MNGDWKNFSNDSFWPQTSQTANSLGTLEAYKTDSQNPTNALLTLSLSDCGVVALAVGCRGGTGGGPEGKRSIPGCIYGGGGYPGVAPTP